MSDRFMEWLERDDTASRPSRAERLELLVGEYGSPGWRGFFGAPMSLMAFEEARQAYVCGLFLSCTIMCQVCLEYMLAGLYRMFGRDDLDRAGFAKILRTALEERFISQDEFDLFERFRNARNPYVHHRPPLRKDSVELRALEQGSSFDEVIAEDAEMAIVSLLRLCQRHPFAIPDTM